MEERVDTEVKRYLVTFEIEYRAEYGQTIFVMGDIGELGHWKKLLFELKWHDGKHLDRIKDMKIRFLGRLRNYMCF